MFSPDNFMFRAMTVWNDDEDLMIFQYGMLYGKLRNDTPDGMDFTDAEKYLLGSLERYIQAYRVKALADHWASLPEMTTTDVARFDLTPLTSLKINGLIGHYGIPRTFIFVYLHAHMLYELHRPSPLAQLNALVAELELPS